MQRWTGALARPSWPQVAVNTRPQPFQTEPRLLLCSAQPHCHHHSALFRSPAIVPGIAYEDRSIRRGFVLGPWLSDHIVDSAVGAPLSASRHHWGFDHFLFILPQTPRARPLCFSWQPSSLCIFDTPVYISSAGSQPAIHLVGDRENCRAWKTHLPSWSQKCYNHRSGESLWSRASLPMLTPARAPPPRMFSLLSMATRCSKHRYRSILLSRSISIPVAPRPSTR